MSKILLFNSYSIVDNFLLDRIEKQGKSIKIVRSSLEMNEQLKENHFDYVLINIDDQIEEVPRVVELAVANNDKIKVVIFGQYVGHIPLLRKFDVITYLSECPTREEFDAVLID